MLILGAQEAEAGTVSVRSRDTGETETMSPEEFVAKVLHEIETRAHA